MVDWNKYDEKNPPQLDTEMLVFTNDGNHAVVARLEKWDSGEYVWTEPREEMTVVDVTHYAEIKPPDKRKET